MKKIIIQGLIIITLFFSTWYLLSRIDWIVAFKVEKNTSSIEKKLGDLIWKEIQRSEKVVTNTFIIKSVDSLLVRICSSNNIDRKLIKIHILHDADVNAFAFPDGHLAINSGLILNAINQEELSGVISHELAHIQHKHVMNKLVKEIGLSILVSITTGNSGPQVIKETVKLLSSSAFDRSLEKEADLKAVDYLVNASIDPEPFANFLFRLSENESETSNYLTWISTHPHSQERAAYIIEYSKDMKKLYKPVLAAETWLELKEKLSEENTSDF